jgi:hypothetical protein
VALAPVDLGVGVSEIPKKLKEAISSVHLSKPVGDFGSRGKHLVVVPIIENVVYTTLGCNYTISAIL